MKRTLLIFLLSPFLMFSQDFIPDWIGNIGGNGLDQFKEFKRDANGSIYVVGEFQDTLFLDDGISQYTLISQGGFDGFVIRFSGDGKILWANALSSTDNLMVNDIDLDANGNFYIVGDFKGTVFFDFNAIATPLSVPSQNGYLASYDTLGNYNWAIKLGNVASDGEAISVVCDRQTGPNKIHVAGHFVDSINCDPTFNNPPLLSTGGNSVFKAVFDDLGTYISSFAYGQGGLTYISDMEYFPNGDMIMAGGFIGSSSIDPQNTASAVASVLGSADAYLMLIDQSDNLVWRNLYGGAGLENITDVEIDNVGNILIGGYFSDSVVFDPSSGFYEMTQGGTDAFLLKCNIGGGYEWFSSGGGLGNDRLIDVSVAPATNNIACIGSFTNQFQLVNSGTSYTLSSAGGRDLFLSFYDPNSSILRLLSMGSSQDEEAGAIVRLSNGILIGGTYVDSMDVNSSSSTDMIYAVNGQDAVIMSLFNCNTTFATINPIECNVYLSPSGNIYTSSGIYNDTIQNAGGCDSVITINLQLGITTIDTFPVTVCLDYLSVGGNLYTNSGIYNDTLSSTLGCDSIIVTDLTIRDSSVIASVNGDTLVCQGSNVSLAAVGSPSNSYSWFSADSISIITLGSSFFLSNLEADTLLVMRSFDGLCETFFPFEVKLFPTNASPNILGDEEFCKGDTMLLQSDGSYDTFQWTFPDGTILIDSFLQVVNIQPLDTGFYILQGIDANNCLTESDTFDVKVNEMNFPNVFSNSPVCFGDQLTMSTLSTFDSVVWTSPVGVQFNLDTVKIGTTSSSYVDGSWQIECHDTTTGCVVTDITPIFSITIVNKAYTIIPNDTVCPGESVSITAIVDPTASIEWMSADSSLVLTSTPSFTLNNVQTDTIIVLKVIDQGCVSFEAITISVFPQTPAPTISGDDQVCQGDSILLFDGGFISWPAYQWTSPSNLSSTLSSFQINAANSSTDEGYYTLQVTDFNGCQSGIDSLFVSIVKLSKPVLTTNSPICFGEVISFNSSSTCDVLNLIGPGATNAYSTATFTIDSFDANYNSGIFRLECIDTASGCSIESNPTFVLIKPLVDPPIVSYPTQVCYGTSASLNVISLLGASYNWYLDSALTIPALVNGSSVVLNNMTSDTTLYLQIERFGCVSDVETISINVLPIPQAISIIGNNTLCEGDLLNISSGVSASSYLWTGPNGQTSQDSSLFIPNSTTNLSGVFTLQAIDQNGCSMGQSSITVTVNQPPQVPQVVGLNQVCAGTPIQYYLTANYDSIRWINPLGSFIYSDTLLIPQGNINYQSGTWSVQVIDFATSCTSDTNFSVAILANPTPIVNVNGPVCVGDSLVFETTSLSQFSYLWSSTFSLIDTISTQSDLILTNALSDTTVYVQVTYPNGCLSDIVTVTGNVNPIPLQPTIFADTIRCVGGTINLTSPTSSFDYIWSTPSGAIYTGQSVSFISSSVQDSGLYSLAVVDSNGCSSNAATWLIRVFDRPAIPIVNDIRICDGDTLAFLINSQGSNSVYQWLPPSSTNIVSSDSLIILPNSTTYNSGIWYVYAQDTMTSCVSELSQSFVQIDSVPSVLNPSSVSPICYGGSTSLSVLNSNVSYFWYTDSSLTQLVSNAMPFEPADIISDTTFYLQIGNILSCLSTPQPFQVLVNPAPSLDVDVDLQACEGDTLTFRSLTNTANYLWSGPDGFYSTSQNTIVFPVSPASAGSYTLSASDSTGCLFKDTTFNVQVNFVPPKPVVLSDSLYCNGDSIILVSSASCGQVIWTNTNKNDVIADSLIISPGSPYYNADQWAVTCVDTSTGCSSRSPRFTVSLIDSLAISIFDNGPICLGDLFEAEAISVNGDSYTWYDNDTITALDSTNFLSISPLVTTSYVVKVQRGSCLSYASVLAVVDSNSSYISAMNDTVLISTNGSQVYNVLSNDSVQLFFSIDIIQTMTQGSVVNQNNGEFSFDLSGVQTDQVLLYEICSPVCNAGCDTAEVFIDIDNSASCDIPNIFTPNGDNVNDVFSIPCISGLGHQIFIFNRWGDIVYESDNYQSNWDGRHRGEHVPDGTYFYILRTRDLLEFQGSVEIRR